ncbi:hypothetical protein [Lewinella sp. W8]|uniref:hypothetical protein n=1 Tax=Lewinella sp. W8 TaxID=2528208 RepID=UPI0010678403|nr:hypothetical protein [Lewinella sp. W8]MTB52349.1 hypothetical protein [Lewinella sp. W8]
MSNRYMLYRHLCWLILMAMSWFPAVAQNNVQLLNEASFLSETAVNDASGRLSTELPGRDVRISYVTNFVTVRDRYLEYTDEPLDDFLQMPNPAGFTPPSQADREAAVNTAIHHAITSTTSVANTIHIIYAVAISLNASGEEEYEVRKFFQFGSSVPKRDKKIVEQIIPDPELLAAGDISGNDIYLADYVEELIAALTDPNYVINGTIAYEGDNYYDGDTIFYFHLPDEIIETQLAQLQEVDILINQNYPVSNLSWFEAEQIPGAGPIITSTSQGRANLSIKHNHFGGLAKLVATYGGETSTVWFYPVNPQLDLGIYEDYVMESHEDISINLEMKNNKTYFNFHPSLKLQTDVLTAYGSISSYMWSLGPNDYNILEWSRLEDQCDYVDLRFHLIRGNQTIITRTKRIQIKCPIKILGLRAMSHDSETGTINTDRIALGGFDGDYPGGRNDTLFIVSNDNDLSRKIRYEIVWEGGPPQPEDYWGESGNAGATGVEPIWYFGSPGLNLWDVSPEPATTYHREGEFSVLYNSSAFPGAWVFNPDVGDVDENHYEAGVRAFREFENSQIVAQEHQKVNIAFVRDSRFDRTRDLGSLGTIILNGEEVISESPTFFQFLSVIFAAKNDIESFMDDIGLGGTYLDQFLDEFEPGTSIEESYFQKEDESSRHYLNVIEKAYKASLNKEFGPYPVPSLGVDLWIGRLGIFWGAELGLYYLEEKALEKYYFANEYQQTGLTYEHGFNGGISLQGGFTTNEEYEGVFQVTALGSASASVELKCKDNFSPSGYESTTYELHIMPIVLGINLVLTLGSQDSGYNWDVFNETYSWHLSDKMEFVIGEGTNGCFGTQ